MSWFIDPFTIGYLQRALIELTLLSVLAGTVGVVVQMRKLSFFVDTLTHAMFPGLAVAYALGAPLLTGSLFGAALGALGTVVLTQLRRVTTDVALSLIGTVMFAIGVMVVSARRSFASDLETLLFGRILTVSRGEVLATALMVVIAVAMRWRYRWLLLSTSFEHDQRAVGPDALLMGLTAAAMAMCSVVVGTLLATAVLLIPVAIVRLASSNRAKLGMGAFGVAAVAGYASIVGSRYASIEHDVRIAPTPLFVTILLAVFLAGAATQVAVKAARGSKPMAVPV